MERYLEGDIAVVRRTRRRRSPTAWPTRPCSRSCAVRRPRRIGVDRLAQFLAEIAPSPLNRPALHVMAGDSETDIACDPNADPLAVIGKTIADPFVGRVSLLKVCSGTLKPDTVLTNTRTRSDERLHGLFTLRGKDHEPVTDVPAGDLVAVAKLADSATGDTLAPKGMPVRAPMPTPPTPSLWVAIKPKTQGDDDKLMTSLHRLQEEDPDVVRRAQRRNAPVAARRRGRNPPRRDQRTPDAEVRRRSCHRGGRGSVPRDDHAIRPPPKAVTRSRAAVTASSGCARSRSRRLSAARFPLRRQDRRRRHPASVHPRGRERASSKRCRWAAPWVTRSSTSKSR